MQSQKWQNDLCSFPRQTIQYHSNPNLCPNQQCWRSWTVLWRPSRPSRTNTQKGCPFHYRGLECKVGSQEIPGVTGKLGLGVQNEAGQRLKEFCQENALVIANTFFQQHKRTLHMDVTTWSISKSDWFYIYIYAFSYFFHYGLLWNIEYSSLCLLFIHSIYNSLHLLIPDSQSIYLCMHPALATTSLFFMSVSRFLFHR